MRTVLYCIGAMAATLVVTHDNNHGMTNAVKLDAFEDVRSTLATI